jgi:hypothetical protein
MAQENNAQEGASLLQQTQRNFNKLSETTTINAENRFFPLLHGRPRQSSSVTPPVAFWPRRDTIIRQVENKAGTRSCIIHDHFSSRAAR